MEPTREQLAQRVADLEAANKALLEQCSLLSIAYIGKRLSDLDKHTEKLSRQYAELLAATTQNRERLDRASSEFQTLSRKVGSAAQ